MASRLHVAFLIFFVAAAASASAAERVPQLIASLDSDAGLQLKKWSRIASAQLEFVTDTALVTEGKAAMRMVAKTTEQKEGSKYTSVVVTVEPFRMKDHLLLMDVGTTTPDRTRGFYVRLRDAKGKIVASWSTWRLRAKRGEPKRVRLQQGLNLDGMGYEKRIVEAPDALVKTIEIIMGTRDPNVEFDLVVDNVRIWDETLHSLKTLGAPRKLVLQTSLSPVLIVPASQTPHVLVAGLLGRLKQLGGEGLQVALGDGRATPDWRETTILIGNVANNRAVFPLYAHDYCSVDQSFPGKGGYVVRVIHDPFGTGKNVVLVGASDNDGLGKGVAALVEKLKPGPTLDPVIEVVLGEDAQKAWGRYHKPLSGKQIAKRVAGARKRLDSGGARGVCSEMATLGLAYRMSGRPEHAELFKGLAYEYEKWVYDSDRKYGAHEGQWGMDVDFTTYRLIPAWDALEECPVFSDEDRLRITRLLAAFLAEDTYPCGRSVLRGSGPRHNHQTFPCLGMYFAGGYFSQFVNCFEAEHWLETAAACFGCQATYLKAREDAAGYQWLVPQHTQRYALAAGDMTAFWSGNARRLCDLAVMLTDNLGHHPAFGDHSGFGGWSAEMTLLHYGAYVYGDGRYRWTIDKKMAIRRRPMLNAYVGDLPPIEPVDLAGVCSFSLPRIMFEHYQRSSKIDFAEGFDKIAFRQDFDEGTEYFLLDGISGTSHGHYDGNGVLRLLARKRLWLEDGDYIKSLPKFHNTLLIFRDGQSEKPSTFAKLEELADFPQAGFSQTLLSDYVGADWRRNVVWLKGRAFVVIDTVAAQTPGDYRLRCVWRGMGEVKHDAQSVVLEQQGEALRIMSAGAADMMLEDDPTRGHNWRRYKLAPPVVRVLSVSTGAQLGRDDAAVIYSVLRPSSAADAGDLEARILRPGVVRVECDGKPFLCGCSSERRAEPVGVCEGVSTDAMVFRFGQDGFEVVNATTVALGDWRVDSSTPVHLSVESTSGLARIYAREAGRLTISSGPPVTFEAGRTEVRTALPPAIPGLKGTDDQVLAFEPSPWKPAEARPDRGLAVDWQLRARPTRLLVTNNVGRFGAVDLGATVDVTPAPRKNNCFNAASPNSPAALTDGVLTSTESSVMWPIDAKVAVTYDLKQPVRISEVVLKIWFGSTSSKGQSFMTERIRVSASNDNFAQDRRLLLDNVDDAKHDDWGKPLTVTCRGDEKLCRWVRIELTPRKGSSVYLSEAEIWADGNSISWDQQPRSMSADFLSVAPGPQGLVALGGSNGGVYLADANGKQLWRSETGERVPSVWCGDLDGDGTAEVVAGSRDGAVHCFARDGSRQWQFDCEPYHGRTGALVCVFAADLDGDGKKEVVAGSDNWHFHVLGCDGSFRWKYETVHRSTCGIAADLDGDDKLEVVGCTEYYSWTVIRHDGKRYWRRHGGPCANAVAAGDLNGDGKLEVAFGSANGMVYVNAHNGKKLWELDTGDEITAVEFVDLDQDGKAEIAAASLNYSVYLLSGDGKIRWRRDLGSPVTHLAACGTILVAGCSDGSVVALNATGEEIARKQMNAAVLGLKTVGPDAFALSVAGRGLMRVRLAQ